MEFNKLFIIYLYIFILKIFNLNETKTIYNNLNLEISVLSLVENHFPKVILLVVKLFKEILRFYLFIMLIVLYNPYDQIN